MEFFSPDDVRRVVAYLTKVVNVHGTAHVEIEFRLGRKTAATATARNRIFSTVSQGAALSLMLAGLLSLAFMGFAGLGGSHG